MAGRKTQSVLTALYGALREVETAKGDDAAAALAKRYAALIDDDPTLAPKVGPLLLDALRELCMTPRARAAVVKGGGNTGDGSRPASELDELRERARRRRAGQHATPAVDPTAT